MNAIFSLLLTGAAISDRKNGKIPNKLLLIGTITGLCENLILRGAAVSAWNMLIAAAVTMLSSFLWRWKVIGGGDVKLLGVSALYLGKNIVPFLVCSGICMAFACVGIMMKRKNFMERMKILWFYLECCIANRKIMEYPFHPETDAEKGGIKLAYGFLLGHAVALSFGLYSA